MCGLTEIERQEFNKTNPTFFVEDGRIRKINKMTIIRSTFVRGHGKSLTLTIDEDNKTTKEDSK